MDKIIRCITSDGAIMAACVDASVQPQLWAICSNRKMRQSISV